MKRGASRILTTDAGGLPDRARHHRALALGRLSSERRGVPPRHRGRDARGIQGHHRCRLPAPDRRSRLSRFSACPRRPASGSVPSGVSWSIASGRTAASWQRPCPARPRAARRGAESARPERLLDLRGRDGRFAPVPTHNATTLPSPFAWSTCTRPTSRLRTQRSKNYPSRTANKGRVTVSLTWWARTLPREGGDPRLKLPGSKEEKESLGPRLQGRPISVYVAGLSSALQVPPLLEPARRDLPSTLTCAGMRWSAPELGTNWAQTQVERNSLMGK
jgi:hypothetical protein